MVQGLSAMGGLSAEAGGESCGSAQYTFGERVMSAGGREECMRHSAEIHHGGTERNTVELREEFALRPGQAMS